MTHSAAVHGLHFWAWAPWASAMATEIECRGQLLLSAETTSRRFLTPWSLWRHTGESNVNNGFDESLLLTFVLLGWLHQWASSGMFSHFFLAAKQQKSKDSSVRVLGVTGCDRDIRDRMISAFLTEACETTMHLKRANAPWF